MYIKTSIGIIVFLFSLTQCGLSQDFGFNQFENMPLYLNPALTGTFDGNHRLISNLGYNQNDIPSSLTNKSTVFTYDSKLNILKNTNLGLGFNYLNTRDKNIISSSTDYAHSQHYSLTASLIKNLSKDSLSTQFIAFGFDIGLTQRKLRYNNWTNAITPSMPPIVDPDIPNWGFDVTRNKFIHPDLSLGIVWEKRLKNKNRYRFGVAVHHLNKINNSFFSRPEELAIRYTIHASSEMRVKDKFLLLPSVLFLKQGEFKQFMYGGSARLTFNQKTIFSYIQFGTWLKSVSGILIQEPKTLVFLIESQVQKVLLSFSFETRSRKALGNKGLELSLGYTFG